MRKSILYYLFTLFGFTIFGLTIFLLLAGCDDYCPQVSTNTRPWLEEADFIKDPSLHATPDQVVVLDLEPATPDTEGDFTSTIRYLVSKTATFSFFIPPDDPHITAIQLLKESGEVLLHHDGTNDCQVTIPAGRYTMHIYHDGSLIDAAGKKAFIHQPQKARLANDSFSEETGLPSAQFMAFKGPNGKFVTADTSDAPLYSLQSIATTVGPYEVWGFTNGGTSTDGSIANKGNNKHIKVSFMTDWYSYFTGESTTPKLDSNGWWRIEDLGNWQFNLKDITVTGGGTVKAWANVKGENGQLFRDYDYGNHHLEKAIFTAGYMGVQCDPCDSDGLSLQEGEVALFAGCNYTGPAFIFLTDVPDFSLYEDAADQGLGMGDNMVASVRVGPNTFVMLYANTKFGGHVQGIRSDTPCLDDTALGSGVASSLKVTLDAKQYAIATNTCENCDLTGIDVSGLDMTAAYFPGSNFTNANCTNTNFRSARLEDTVFSGATTKGTNFFGADLYCMDLSGTDLSTATFDDDPIITKDFTCRLDLTGATLNIDAFPFASWRYLDLTDATILNGNGATLSTVANPLDLSGAKLSGTKGLTGVFLDGANLGCTTYANGNTLCTQLIGTNLYKTSLQHAVLKESLLNGANLNYTNLEGADLSGAQLLKSSSPLASSAASIEGAYLKNANLSQADLSGVSMTNANFYSSSSGTCSGAQWNGKCATAQDATLNSTDFADAYLSGVDFSGAILQGANFKQAILLGANLTNTDLSVDATTGVAANFSGAFLHGADFTDAKTSNAIFNNAYVDLSSSSGGLLAFQLPVDNLTFTDCEANQRSCTGCVFFTYNGTTVVPLTTSNNTCPDGNFGPCTNTQWENPTIAIENATPPSSSDLSKLPGGCSLDFNW